MELKINKKIFKNYPIDFKEVNPEDFTTKIDKDGKTIKSDEFIVDNNGAKIIIEPNHKGYINDALQKEIQLEVKNTVVINAAVGQGKSYSIINTISRFIEDRNTSENEYLIIVASPFTSLVKQYFDDINYVENCSESVFNYNTLKEDDFSFLYKPIHVMTVNCLLENPGESSFLSSELKRNYITKLINYCKENGTKVVFVFDEIHDSYHNFKQEFIYNLWKWEQVIHKIFVISATYNEASKIVIKYLAELTEKRIKLIESKRIRISGKQSKLFLHYSPTHNYDSNTKEIVSVIEKSIKDDKNIDILCYSKNLAKKILSKHTNLGKLLVSKYGELQDCTSKSAFNTKEKSNSFIEDKCNIGTNFKTGISIKKENHSYIIIMPPASSLKFHPPASGIFLGGINSVIQALARQRQEGEIHIILPEPKFFDYSTLDDTLMSDNQKKYFKQVYEAIRSSHRLQYESVNYLKAKYIPLSYQNRKLSDFYYKELIGNIEAEIESIKKKERQKLPQLNYPDFETFKLTRGENYLANNYDFYGKDLSTFTTYSAVTNQFINCQLEQISFRDNIYFDEESLEFQILELINAKMTLYEYRFSTNAMNFNMFYDRIRKLIFEEHEPKQKKQNALKKVSPKKISKLNRKDKKFEQALIRVVEMLFFEKKEYDKNFNRSKYILANISQLDKLDYEKLKDNERNRYNLFMTLKELRDSLLENAKEHKKPTKSFKYLPNKNSSLYLTKENENRVKGLRNYIKSDILLKNEIYIYHRAFKENEDNLGVLSKIYSYLLEDFFETKKVEPVLKKGEEQTKVNKIIKVKTIEDHELNIDTISDSNFYQNFIKNIIEYNSDNDDVTSDEEIIKLLENNT